MEMKPDWRCETLPEGAVLTRRRAGGLCVLCVSGRVWVTEAGLAEDHLLQSGQHCVVRGPGLVVIEALRDALIVQTDPMERQGSWPFVRNRGAKKAPPGLGEGGTAGGVEGEESCQPATSERRVPAGALPRPPKVAASIRFEGAWQPGPTTTESHPAINPRN